MKWMLGGSMVLALAACGPEDDAVNDDDLVYTTAGANTGTTAAGTTGDTAGTTQGATTGDTAGTTGDTAGTTEGATTGNTTGTTTEGTTTGATGDAGVTTGAEDGGTTGMAEGGTSEPTQSVIPGTASGCTSYGTANGTMCAGYYCQVTVEDVAAELIADAGPCSGLSPERICEGSLTQTVATCAREKKTEQRLPFSGISDEEVRQNTADCVYEDTQFSDVSMACLDCFLDAAECAGENCVLLCLAGDSASCDQCRLDNDCNQPLPACAGLPDPF